MMNPNQSEIELIKMVSDKKEGISLEEALAFERRKDVYLGPESNAFYTLLKSLTLGVVLYNDDTGKFVSP